MSASSRRRRPPGLAHLSCVLVLGAAAACAGGGTRAEPATQSGAGLQFTGPPASARHVLDVPGRRSAAPALAAQGHHAVLAWTASDGTTTDLFAAVSTNSGQTFSNPRRVNDLAGDVTGRVDEPPRLALTRRGDALRVVAAWTSSLDGAPRVRLAVSDDGGFTFGPATTIARGERDGVAGWPSVAVRPDGTPVVVWLGASRATRATDIVPVLPSSPGSAMGTARGGSLYAIAWGGARSDPLPAPIARDACRSAVVVDTGGAVHVAWRQRAPRVARIAVAQSADAARTFDAPTFVSDDPPERGGCPDTGLTMTVDVTGLMHVVWRSALSDDGPETGLFLAWSRDGQAFTRRTRVAGGDARDPARPQMTVVGGSDVALVWDEQAGTGRRVVLRLTAGMCGRVSDPFGPPRVVSGGTTAASHPVVASANDGLLVAWTEGPSESSSVVVRLLVWPEIEGGGD